MSHDRSVRAFTDRVPLMPRSWKADMWGHRTRPSSHQTASGPRWSGRKEEDGNFDFFLTKGQLALHIPGRDEALELLIGLNGLVKSASWAA